MNGTTKPDPKVTVLLPESLDMRLRIYATKNRLTLSAVAIEAFTLYLDTKDYEEVVANEDF